MKGFVQFSTYFIVLLLPSIYGFTCVEDKDCNNHGFCQHGKCNCDPTYMEPDCQYFPYKLPVAYPSFFYPMSFVNLLLLVASSYRLYQFFQTFQTFQKWKLEFSVRHLAIAMVWAALFGRMIFFATNFDGNWNRNTTGFLPFFFYLFYPCVAVAFSCELLVWMELYTTTTLHNIERLPRYRKLLMIFNAIVFPVEIILRIAIILSPVSRMLLLVWFSFLGILVFTETIGFLVIATLLLRKVQRMKSITGQQQQKAAFTKLTGTLLVQTFVVILACLLFIATTFTVKQHAFLFLMVNVIARLVEFTACIFILVIIKPQPHRVNTTTVSTQVPSKTNSVEKNYSSDSVPMASVVMEDISNMESESNMTSAEEPNAVP